MSPCLPEFYRRRRVKEDQPANSHQVKLGGCDPTCHKLGPKELISRALTKSTTLQTTYKPNIRTLIQMIHLNGPKTRTDFF
ncbi:hypothetical protein PIB30_004533 [Stylosanthes scabra]|uniref:Uncharacterized protein n=1 Tax=Stylosanthes scabra TaxID=79078 RepID=A0ABU6Y1T2_9FABA|nr:hypothetical protein [Stylosanthes scabra]